MEQRTPFFIEVVPSLRGFWCKALLFLLSALLSFGPVGVGMVVAYGYGFWMGIAFFLFFTLISGVILSKMRIDSIPYAQREMDYSTHVIVKWYLSKHTCFHQDHYDKTTL